MPFGPRSAASRQAILDAARRHFAADGYDGATIRAIAADAGIDPSMVIRYFGTKAELYAAVSVIDLAVPDLGELDGAGQRYARALLDRWEGGENAAELMLLRSASTNSDAAEQVRRIFEEQIAPAVAAVVREHLGSGAAALREARTRAALLLSQTIGLVYCRYLLGVEPLASMDADELVTALGRALQVHLEGERPDPG